MIEIYLSTTCDETNVIWSIRFAFRFSFWITFQRFHTMAWILYLHIADLLVYIIIRRDFTKHMRTQWIFGTDFHSFDCKYWSIFHCVLICSVYSPLDFNLWVEIQERIHWVFISILGHRQYLLSLIIVRRLGWLQFLISLISIVGRLEWLIFPLLQVRLELHILPLQLDWLQYLISLISIVGRLEWLIFPLLLVRLKLHIFPLQLEWLQILISLISILGRLERHIFPLLLVQLELHIFPLLLEWLQFNF